MKKPKDNQTSCDAEHRPRNYSRWRAATLTGVYVLMGLHIAHWKITGKTLAPLELNEVMYTLELGIVTAGFLLMTMAVLSVFIFGRFFCSWGCHILALEDLSGWILEKIGIRPKPIRSRLLLLVPPGAMIYMFIWPQFKRLMQGKSLPKLHITGDESGWASFLTDDFWRNLPGPGVTVFTFFFVGFVIIYFLGTRSFCRYACPYGAIFSLADRFAPGRIIAQGDCSGCGTCTAKCQSHIRVHEELTVFGQIVDPSCLKDLDCISNCPEGNIGYGFRKPSFFKSFKHEPGVKNHRYDFTLAEEGLMLVVFLITLFAYRGLYGLVPFLLSLAFGGILAYGAVLCVRLVRSQNVRLNNFQLKRAGRLSGFGFIFAVFAVLITTLTAQSAFIRYHEQAGWRIVNQLQRSRKANADVSGTLNTAITHLSFTKRWGLYTAPILDKKLVELHITLSEKLAEQGKLVEAIDGLTEAVALYPDSAKLRYNRGVMLAAVGREAEAMSEYEEALRVDQGDPETWNNLGFLLLRQERSDEAEKCFLEAIKLNPEFAHPHFNLARIMVQRERIEEAEHYLQRAAELDPIYKQFLSEPGTERKGGS